MAAAPVFAKIVNDTSPWSTRSSPATPTRSTPGTVPVPGQPGKTRPIVQTGNYGENIGKVVLTIDLGQRRGHRLHARSSLPRTTVGRRRTLVAHVPARCRSQDHRRRRAGLRRTGRQPAGRLGHGRHHDRLHRRHLHRPAALHRWHAVTIGPRSRRWATSSPTRCSTRSTIRRRGGAEIGVVNPGGLRAELFYAPGRRRHLRRGERRAAVRQQPVDRSTLTGAQFKTMLEQQWQRDADGTVPTRAYLQLGPVEQRHVHLRPDAAGGVAHHLDHRRRCSRSTRPATYRIGTFSFLVDRRRQLPRLHPGHRRTRLRSRRPRRAGSTTSHAHPAADARLRPPGGVGAAAADERHEPARR